MYHKHSFDPKAFRRQCLPFVFLAILPSLLLDGYLAYSLVTGQPNFFLQAHITTVWDVAAPFAANFILLKAPAVYAYLRIRLQRLASYVRTYEKQVIYRRSKMALSVKLEQGICYHDDFYFRDITRVVRKKSGTVVAYGEIPVFRKLFGVEAVLSQRTKKRAAIPSYYTDSGSIAHKLCSLASENKSRGVPF